MAAYRRSGGARGPDQHSGWAALNWRRQEDLRAQMSEIVLFGKIKDPELIVLNFRGHLQCRMG